MTFAESILESSLSAVAQFDRTGHVLTSVGGRHAESHGILADCGRFGTELEYEYVRTDGGSWC
jgi:hypothetical protein